MGEGSRRYFPVQERQGTTGEGPAEGYKDGEGTGASPLGGQAERAGPVQPAGEKTQGGCVASQL